MASLDIRESRSGDVVILSLTGRLVPDQEDVLVRERIDDLLEQGVRRVVLDLHDVVLLDSGGIGVLVAKLTSLRARGGDLRLARMTHRTERILTITHLLTVFETFDSVEAAVASFDSTREAGESLSPGVPPSLRR